MTSAYITGMTIKVKIIDDTSPPIIGAAMRFIGCAPVPDIHMIGSNPMIIVATVIIFGRTRMTAPWMIAS